MTQNDFDDLDRLLDRVWQCDTDAREAFLTHMQSALALRMQRDYDAADDTGDDASSSDDATEEQVDEEKLIQLQSIRTVLQKALPINALAPGERVIVPTHDEEVCSTYTGCACLL